MKKRKINYNEHSTPKNLQYPDISGVASANECTGLMYKTPTNEDEHESYQELSSMEIPKIEPQTKVYPMRFGENYQPKHMTDE